MKITQKTFPDVKTYSIDYCGRPLSLEVGKLAELAGASVLTKYGETTVLVTCTASARPREGMDYFPLSVDFEEKLYAVGRIPGSFNRREGRPSLNAVLASRMIDRPMRPLFPDDLRNDVVISCTVMSLDRDCSPEITAMIGAAAAVAISEVPFNGPIAAIELGYDGKNILFNPTHAQKAENQMTVTLATTHEKVVMIEATANQIPEDVMYDAIVQGHEKTQAVLDLIDKMTAEVGKEKFSYDKASFDDELFEKILQNDFTSMEHCMDTDDKKVREERVQLWIDEVVAKYEADHPEIMSYMEEIIYKIQKKVVKNWLLAGKRVDGRAMDEIRPLGAEVGLIPKVHGSGLFTRGQTQVLSIATLNTISAAQKLDTIWEEESKRFLHHYNFPAYSVGEARASRSTNRREYGHGALAEKALEPVIPDMDDFPYTIRLVSEVLSSNGSTSQGSICGSTLALMDAGVPIKAPVAGISCGLIQDGEKFTTFIDIQGVEDFHGEMDFKVAGTKDGITAIQMDLKNDGLKHEIVKEALELTRDARYAILDEIMLPCIAEPRAELADTAPKMIKMQIDPDKIREVIGSGGKVIQKITADTGCKIDIEDDGTIFIASEDINACREARGIIENIVFVPEVGKIYQGKVVRIIPIGAFIELVPGKDGMCHIKDLEFKRTEKVEDVVEIGDITWVKVTGIDERGRVNLSRKDALKERGEA
ncbi:polyribonucleotide nucleotidyltransferase [Clostridiaceae bacterium OttesenSCG-928-D20]|nr:polyribonucleotide nucleotidyltransferase [Clostridiaceae bacterium OttesenSCG-928-D20]